MKRRTKHFLHHPFPPDLTSSLLYFIPSVEFISSVLDQKWSKSETASQLYTHINTISMLLSFSKTKARCETHSKDTSNISTYVTCFWHSGNVCYLLHLWAMWSTITMPNYHYLKKPKRAFNITITVLQKIILGYKIH